MLYSLGFAASYGKTVEYEISTAYHTQPRILSSESGALVRYVGDNADINVHTLDGPPVTRKFPIHSHYFRRQGYLSPNLEGFRDQKYNLH
ncbi:hypothetical protein TNIN_434011 [Trichonephila inaurata madagascariensis]|uniref:Uncharacterized protein n=1 Tax=Trichonephila inaurata madagascariensis TaxID=2747483 RepID=A0A8X6WSU9_9ARAC|nr:hypothetical protein TNIN_434011 [Trichonephila inaurata madagascariensis]